MERTVELPERSVKLLVQLPEDGMGYHVVDVILKDGRIIKDQLVLDSSLWPTDLDVDGTMVDSVRKSSRPRGA